MATITHKLWAPVREEGIIKTVFFNTSQIDRADLIVIKGGHYLNFPLHWKLIAARIALTTSAAVANRYLMISHYDKQNNLLSIISGPAVAASQAVALTVGQVQSLGGSAAYGETGGYIGLTGEGLQIEGDGSIRFNIDTNQANDVWSIAAMFKYMGKSEYEWQRLQMH